MYIAQRGNLGTAGLHVPTKRRFAKRVHGLPTCTVSLAQPQGLAG